MKPQEPSLAQHKKSGLRAILLIFALCPTGSVHALDLLQSYRLALKQDASYQAALAANAASQEAKPKALAELLPNLSATGSRSKNQTNSVTPGFFGPNHSTSHYLSHSYVIQLRQPIYRHYQFAQYRQAEHQVSSADATLDFNRQQMLSRLCGTYFEALLAQETLALILAQKETYSAQLKSAQRYLETGLGTRTDVDDAQARHDMIVANEFEARKNVDQAYRQLQVIINQPAGNLAELNPARLEIRAPHPANPEDWVKRGEEINPELRTLRANIEAAKEEISKAGSGHYPTVDFFAQRSHTGSASDNTIGQRYQTNQFGIQVNIPLFSGGYVTASKRQAVAALEQHQQLYEAKRREIDALIRKEYATVAESVIKIKAYEQAERSSDQAVFSNQKGFQAGTRTLVDILNAQQQRMIVKRDLAQARFLYLMSRIRLQMLVGTLDENEIKTINNWLNNTSPAKSGA